VGAAHLRHDGRAEARSTRFLNSYVRARRLASEAGFSKFEVLKIENPFNQFFALKR